MLSPSICGDIINGSEIKKNTNIQYELMTFRKITTANSIMDDCNRKHFVMPKIDENELLSFCKEHGPI